MDASSLCPFASSTPVSESNAVSALQPNNREESAGERKLTRVPTGRARVRLLYEEYIHLPWLRRVWDNPATERPVLEPVFAAAFHGIELGFLLLAEFVDDARTYVSKRPRVERVADDIYQQCRLLTEVVDAELEDEGTHESRLSLTQAFPFEGCPPTTPGPCHSPGLQRLIDAVGRRVGSMTTAERNSLIKLVLNLSAALRSFERWSVGLGIEHQLDALRCAVGLPPQPRYHELFLDYDALVQPWVCEQTLTAENFTHAEDWFFRTVHLGTECWAFVVLNRITSAAQQAASRHWHVAAARAGQAARIMQYLGDHVLLLTTMNLRDYLLLKVELEGTSGEGSVQVKQFRPAALRLFQPLAEQLLGRPAGEGDDEALRQALLAVYEWPDKHSGLYNYAKSLEDLESGLLGGFYYKHFCLAQNVIGSSAKGTMQLPVQALKRTYETPVFPLLDGIRSLLGARIDQELRHVRGRMMESIITEYQRRGGSPSPSPERASARCPFARTLSSRQSRLSRGAGELSPGFEARRQQLYSWEGVPSGFKQAVMAQLQARVLELGLTAFPEGLNPAALAFLDHAWGQLAPLAQHRALVEAAALFQLGNPAWDVLFGRVMPTAASHVRRLLGLPAEAPQGAALPAVHFGSNSHELVGRLLSTFWDRQAQHAQQRSAPLRVMCSDTEFYSLTRQLNRLVEAGLAEVQPVPAEPADSFTERCIAAVAEAAAAGRLPDVIMVSQISYLQQQTLVPSIPALVEGIKSATTAVAGTPAKAVAEPNAAAAAEEQGAAHRAVLPQQPLVIVDAYHGFAAVPTDLSSVAADCCYVGGLLKHAGCGANCAFLVTPPGLALRPVLTGWLADPSVLAPGSPGIKIGSEVGYEPSLALQGGTPAFFLPLLTFNHLMALWQSGQPAIDVPSLHSHVMQLHARFLAGLQAAQLTGRVHPAINLQTQVQPQDAAVRSHTLVFKQTDPATARASVEALAKRGILIDSRKAYVRVGFGPNHSAADCDALLGALRRLAQA